MFQRFYRELLGLPLHLADAHEGDEQPHYEAFWGEPRQPGFFMLILWQADPGVNTVNAYLGFDVDDLMPVHRGLVAAGVTIVLEPTHKPWGWCAEYRDPDGNIVFLNG